MTKEVSNRKSEGQASCKAEHSEMLSQYGKTRYARNSRTISGKLHDELVMMDIDQGKYFSLNPVATRIWDLLEKPLDLDGLCTELMDEYDVGHEQCMKETSELIEEMVKLGLVLAEG